MGLVRHCPRCGMSLYGPQERRCEYCTAVLPPPKPGGRPQRYCTRACRDAAYYRRRHHAWSADDIQERIEHQMEWQERYEAVRGELRAARAEIARLTALVAAPAEMADEGR